MVIIIMIVIIMIIIIMIIIIMIIIVIIIVGDAFTLSSYWLVTGNMEPIGSRLCPDVTNGHKSFRSTGL